MQGDQFLVESTGASRRYWKRLADGTELCVQYVTYGAVHQVPKWYLRPVVQGADPIIFWVRRRSLRRDCPIGLNVIGAIIDEDGNEHTLVDHQCGSYTGPPPYELAYVCELSEVIPPPKSFRLHLSIQDYSRPSNPFVDFEYANEPGWLDELKARVLAYWESAQRLDDDLVFAITKDDHDTVRTLIHSGARLADVNVTGTNDLCYAVHKGDIELVTYLVTHGANVNEASGTGQSPLMFAAMCGNSDLVSELLRLGASVNVKDMYGHTAIDHALKHKRKKIVRLLQAHVRSSS